MTTDITPAHLRCGSGFCPTVNYTPAHLRCAYTGSCPEVAGKDGVLTIVGRQVGHPKAGPGETAVEIGEEYFSALPEMVRLREALSETLEWIKGWDPNFIYDDEWQATRDKIDAALSQGKETT